MAAGFFDWMDQTMKMVKVSKTGRLDTEVLVKALGSVGMARYIEGYDNGGQGDYTKEKHGQPDVSIEEILAMGRQIGG